MNSIVCHFIAVLGLTIFVSTASFPRRLLPENAAAAYSGSRPLIRDRPKGSIPSARKTRRPACNDRRDNDRDGLTDYPRDPGCRSRRDRREQNPRPAPTPTITVPGDSPLGIGASLNGRMIFPPDNPWNKDISAAPVDPNSDNLIASIGLDKHLHPDFGTFWEGAPIGIPYVVVPGNQPKVSVSFDYADESDAGPYPIPVDVPIEGGADSKGDRHVILIDRDSWTLYELFSVYKIAGKWTAGSGAIFDLSSNRLRPAGWTSADAAGLPILPGLVRYDEVYEQGEIRHALRFTVSRSRRGYVHPARHYASNNTDPNLPPMGMRVRLKASFDISPFPEPVRVILRALKKYGMFVADNGSDWFISGAHDPRWDDNLLGSLKTVPGRHFEVVQMSEG